MSHDNPTALHPGMSGMLDGRRYTVAGRVVFSVQLDGETFFWNEFNLVDSGGSEQTLVYEETEDGSPWKLFKRIEPLPPLAVVEAGAKRVGDTVIVDGKTARVTLVSLSRVCTVEGRAPEGTGVGDVANYFNAEWGGEMLVVSWRGGEIEFYQGKTVPAGRIEGIFNLPHRSTPNLMKGFASRHWGEDFSWVSSGATIVFGLVALFGICASSCERDESPPEPPPKQAAPALRLPDGVRCVLEGRAYTVAGYALIEVATIHGKYDRYEYDLAGAAGSHCLLVNSLGGDAHEWHLLTPVESPRDFTPYTAAALRQGRNTVVAGRPMSVIQLFRMQVLKVEDPSAPSVWPATLQYGLVARQNDEWQIARWTESGLRLYDGRALAEKDVLAGFSAK